jgi:RES domain-containing protein
LSAGPAHRRLAQPLVCFRIGDDAGAYPVWSAGGALLNEGRWNALGDPVIYAAEHFSTSALEKLVHWNGILPAGQHYVRAVVPAGVTYEVFQPAAHPGWDGAVETVARAFGSTWVAERRSAVLIVPSVVAPEERNVLVNAAHPDAARIEPGLETPVWWDRRLMRGAGVRP